MKRYQNYFKPNQDPDINSMNKTARIPLSVSLDAKKLKGDSWDAKHMSDFLSKSNYSNWSGDKKNITRDSFEIPRNNHRRSYSNSGEHFFKTTTQDRNASKIGFTPIFPLVSNVPLNSMRDSHIKNFFNTNSFPSQTKQCEILGKTMKMKCDPENKFKFQANALKFMESDPITSKHQALPSQVVSNYSKERMQRLIEKRHPHGMTGIDHPQNPQSTYYNQFEQKIRIREEPNSHRSFLLDREWKSKKASKMPVDQWKHRQTICLRKFRNDNVHGYNILTNRRSEEIHTN